MLQNKKWKNFEPYQHPRFNKTWITEQPFIWFISNQNGHSVTVICSFQASGIGLLLFFHLFSPSTMGRVSYLHQMSSLSSVLVCMFWISSITELQHRKRLKWKSFILTAERRFSYKLAPLQWLSRYKTRARTRTSTPTPTSFCGETPTSTRRNNKPEKGSSFSHKHVTVLTVTLIN